MASWSAPIRARRSSCSGSLRGEWYSDFGAALHAARTALLWSPLAVGVRAGLLLESFRAPLADVYTEQVAGLTARSTTPLRLPGRQCPRRGAASADRLPAASVRPRGQKPRPRTGALRRTGLPGIVLRPASGAPPGRDLLGHIAKTEQRWHPAGRDRSSTRSNYPSVEPFVLRRPPVDEATSRTIAGTDRGRAYQQPEPRRRPLFGLDFELGLAACRVSGGGRLEAGALAMLMTEFEAAACSRRRLHRLSWRQHQRTPVQRWRASAYAHGRAGRGALRQCHVHRQLPGRDIRMRTASIRASPRGFTLGLQASLRHRACGAADRACRTFSTALRRSRTKATAFTVGWDEPDARFRAGGCSTGCFAVHVLNPPDDSKLAGGNRQGKGP